MSQFSSKTGGWRAKVRVVAGAAILVVAAARCHKELLAPIETTYHLVTTSGNGQSAPAGSVLLAPLVVTVLDGDGDPVKGVRVVFHVVRGSSVMLDSIGVTTTDGTATARLRLGISLDTTFVNVHPMLASDRSVTMHATSSTAPQLTSVSEMAVASSDTIALQGKGFLLAGSSPSVFFGSTVVTPLGPATDSTVNVVVPVCLTTGPLDVSVGSGTVRSNALTLTYGSRAVPVTLAPYQEITVTSGALGSCITLDGNGARYLLVPQFASTGAPAPSIDWSLFTTVAGKPSAVVTLAEPVMPSPGSRFDFDRFLRETEQRLAPMARAEAAGRSAERLYAAAVAQAPALGSFRGFKVVSKLDGTAFANVQARLKYVGAHLLLYVDSAGTGFTDGEYAALGKLFDTDLYPIDVNAFGSESDVDGNGRIIVLFTPVVNALVTPEACGNTGYVAGFFYGNDLLTQTPNSNKGEVFYAYVPDSLGVYSCAHPASSVKSLLPDTYIHELQHMISFNQHVLARGGAAEETWLNEGMSHMAEELGSKIYEAKYPAPLGRATPGQLFPDSAGPFISPQMLNSYTYLFTIRSHSVTSYQGGGQVQERGASWLFLRWLADQKGEGILRALEQTSATGIANVETQSGETFGALFGDFGVTLFTDSLTGKPRSAVPSRYRFLSRDLQQLTARSAQIFGFTPRFPLSGYLAVPGNNTLSDMIPGTMTHILLTTSVNQASITLRYSRQDGTSFVPALGAQVGIFRLPP